MSERKEQDYWRKLEAELIELERTDPAVKAAAESYDRMVRKITGKPLPEQTGDPS